MTRANLIDRVAALASELSLLRDAYTQRTAEQTAAHQVRWRVRRYLGQSDQRERVHGTAVNLTRAGRDREADTRLRGSLINQRGLLVLLYVHRGVAVCFVFSA